MSEEFSQGTWLPPVAARTSLRTAIIIEAMVLAGGVEVAEQRLGEEAVPAHAVVGDVVGLRGEGEEKARRVADPGQPVACRAAGAGAAAGNGLFRQASRKTRWMPGPPSSPR